MNFFEHQARARSHSTRLALLLGLSVLLIVAAVDAVVLYGCAMTSPHPLPNFALGTLAHLYPNALALATLFTAGLIVAATLYKIAELHDGGAAVARAMGATPVRAQPMDPKFRRLRNVIEEIAIASGMPVPQVYVLEQEPGINAFAAGYTPADAAICVTRGCLDKLTRDELQGVIAHEFSHIANGDMRLSLRLLGLTFGILVIALAARMVLRAATNSDGGRRAAGFLAGAFAIMIVGYIGVFFARLIKAGFSRERESLADACAVQFTRQTRGLAGALKKIAGLDAGSKFQAAEAEQVSHMLFSDGVGYWALFATHPPLNQRIKALEPGFNPRQLEALSKRWNSPAFVPDDLVEAPSAGLAQPGSVPAASAEHLADHIASPTPENYRQAELTRALLPQALKDLARDPAQARKVLFAMLLSDSEVVRARQLQQLAARFPEARALDEIRSALRELEPSFRLPLAAIAFPALSQAPRAELGALLLAISELSRADGHIELFEFCLAQMLRSQLADALQPARARVAGKLRLPEVANEIALLLCVLARQSSEDPDAARRAYLAGLAVAAPNATIAYTSREDWPSALDLALRKLDGLCGPAKEILLEAMVTTVGHDGRITLGEAELLRTVCAALHCPLPPLLAPQRLEAA